MGHQTADDRWDVKQQRTTWTPNNKGHLGHSSGREQSRHQAAQVFQDQDIRRQRTVRTSSRKGFSGSGHQGEEDSQIIKQKRFFRIRTSGGGGQTGHQTADDRRDVKQQKTTWTSSN